MAAASSADASATRARFDRAVTDMDHNLRQLSELRRAMVESPDTLQYSDKRRFRTLLHEAEDIRKSVHNLRLAYQPGVYAVDRVHWRDQKSGEVWVSWLSWDNYGMCSFEPESEIKRTAGVAWLEFARREVLALRQQSSFLAGTPKSYLVPELMSRLVFRFDTPASRLYWRDVPGLLNMDVVFWEGLLPAEKEPELEIDERIIDESPAPAEKRAEPAAPPRKRRSATQRASNNDSDGGEEDAAPNTAASEPLPVRRRLVIPGTPPPPEHAPASSVPDSPEFPSRLAPAAAAVVGLASRRLAPPSPMFRFPPPRAAAAAASSSEESEARIISHMDVMDALAPLRSAFAVAVLIERLRLMKFSADPAIVCMQIPNARIQQLRSTVDELREFIGHMRKLSLRQWAETTSPPHEFVGSVMVQQFEIDHTLPMLCNLIDRLVLLLLTSAPSPNLWQPVQEGASDSTQEKTKVFLTQNARVALQNITVVLLSAVDRVRLLLINKKIFNEGAGPLFNALTRLIGLKDELDRD